ncbi:MAG TPA: dihydropteroate synthase [Panacibacter sp.]|nr:dihydropteroate synthase [Panacibacter sp.]HNP43430.1 dihydropteroate synthase [Panacibacter sp.]
MFTLNCKGRLLTFNTPVVMGILNTTPDSFYSGSRNPTVDTALATAGKMLGEGAAMLDIGGQSTRPKSEKVSAEEEASRVLPVVEAVSKAFPGTVISIDTYYASVARQAVQAGANMVNDISGGQADDAMLATVASLRVPYVCMHMRGTPQNMHEKTNYDDVALEVLDYFIERTEACRIAGIHDVIIDPGFGFAKSINHSFELLRKLSVFKILEKPMLLGLSRKSSIFKTLGITAAEALNGTTVMNTIGLLNGANILRVHDVKEAMEAVKLVGKYRS